MMIPALLSLLLQAQPEKPELWLYHSVNLLVDANVGKVDVLWRRAAKAGYTKVLLADSKMAKLGDMDKRYFDNVAKVQKIAAELGLEVVPAVFHVGYSNSMLWHDPNLAEGLPVKDQRFVARGGVLIPAADPPVALAKPGFVDETVKMADGVASVAETKSNARFSFPLKVAKHRCYHVSVKVKTDNFSGQPEIKALGGGRSLQWEYLEVEKTQDWKEHHVVFNSLDADQVTVYFGLWGGLKGSLQWKDWKIEESPLVNVLRRPGCPLTIQGGEEGKDVDPIADPKLGAVPWRGEYRSWHEPPGVKTRLADGAEVRISWYHPAVVYHGQVSACISEPKTNELLADEARRVRELWKTKGYMMSHDEFRTMNQDEACRKRNLDAGPLLAENARFCVKLLEGSTVYVWNDMFDPHHNAVKDYYLVRGDLANSWEGLPPEVVIVNWHHGGRDKNLPFFAGRGHRQVIAAYYDGPLSHTKEWVDSASRIKNVVGVMYTTWQNDYSKIEEFARVVRP
jgi:hypothetical protein